MSRLAGWVDVVDDDEVATASSDSDESLPPHEDTANGLPADQADNNTVYDLVMTVAAGDAEVAEIAQALHEVVEGD